MEPHIRFDCHINVEVCVSVASCKYIYKYVHKGGDRQMFDLSTEQGRQQDAANRAARRDEIKYYQDNRSLGACEAAWRIFGFDLADHSPAVLPLPLHLENGQRVYFTNEGEAIAAVEGAPPETTLTAWFQWNETCEEDERHPYYDMPMHCVWNKQAKMWTKRIRGKGSVGRVYTISPTSGELFYLRLLLHNPTSIGATSFKDLKTTPDGVEHETFRAACAALGIIGDDNEWDLALRDAVADAMPNQIRQLFVHLLTACEVASPSALFHDYVQPMADDFKHKAQQVKHIVNMILCKPERFFYDDFMIQFCVDRAPNRMAD